MILFGLSSCATDPLLRSYVVGTWQPVKIGSVDIKNLLPRDDTLATQYTEEDYKMLIELKTQAKQSGEGTSQTSTGADGSAPKAPVDDFLRLLNEANTSYKFATEGHGARFNPDQPVKGTWKLKKKGTKLVLKDMRTKEPFIILIDSLSSKKMVATNKYLNGLKITYIKGN